MTMVDQSSAPNVGLTPASSIDERAKLGQISLVVSLMGVVSVILITLLRPDWRDHLSLLLGPFLGCQIIAFVTGVFSWKYSVMGKCGAMASALMILCFLAGMA